MAHRDGNNVGHFFKYYIEDDMTDCGLLEFDNGEADPETKTYEVKLKDHFGQAPVKLAAGTKLHICMKAKNEESRRTWYHYENNEHDYRKNDNQPLDFEVEYSSHDENGCTRVSSGQFPYILYS